MVDQFQEERVESLFGNKADFHSARWKVPDKRRPVSASGTCGDIEKSCNTRCRLHVCRGLGPKVHHGCSAGGWQVDVGGYETLPSKLGKAFANEVLRIHHFHTDRLGRGERYQKFESVRISQYQEIRSLLVFAQKLVSATV